MPKDAPCKLRKVQQLQEIAELVDHAYNKPDMADGRVKESFRKEYEEVDGIVRSTLRLFGDIDAFGKKDFSMGNPWNSSRKIGVTINTDTLFRREIIESLLDALQNLSVDYLIVLSGEYRAGGGNFYICIFRDGNVVGYAPEEDMLGPFGFS